MIKYVEDISALVWLRKDSVNNSIKRIAVSDSSAHKSINLTLERIRLPLVHILLRPKYAGKHLWQIDGGGSSGNTIERIWVALRNR